MEAAALGAGLGLLLALLLLAAALRRAAPRGSPAAPPRGEGEYRSLSSSVRSAPPRPSAPPPPPAEPRSPQAPGRTATPPPGPRAPGGRSRRRGRARTSRSSTASRTACWPPPSRYRAAPRPAGAPRPARRPLTAAPPQGHSGSVSCLHFSGSGKYLASCADDRTVRLWSTRDFTAREHRCLRANVELDHAELVRFSPDCRWGREPPPAPRGCPVGDRRRRRCGTSHVNAVLGAVWRRPPGRPGGRAVRGELRGLPAGKAAWKAFLGAGEAAVRREEGISFSGGLFH